MALLNLFRRSKFQNLPSFVCRSEHFETEWYRRWALEIAKGNPDPLLFGESFAHTFRKVWEAMSFDGRSPRYRHRKMWEWCVIAQVLHERGHLKPGRRGCGFAVGHEPLASLFAAYGADILATDLDVTSDAGWANTGQHAGSMASIHWPNLITMEALKQRARFQAVDMRDLSGLRGERFDFVWSSCSFEHLGTLEAGLRFVEASVDLLKPGGVAVHTTEFNVSSQEDTLTSGPNVIYRQCDLIELGERLRKRSATLQRLDFDAGDSDFDRDYDRYPFYESGRQHIKLELGGFVSTSVLLVITKDR
jgi:SAM-dependent methyltransferase